MAKRKPLNPQVAALLQPRLPVPRDSNTQQNAAEVPSNQEGPQLKVLDVPPYGGDVRRWPKGI